MTHDQVSFSQPFFFQRNHLEASEKASSKVEKGERESLPGFFGIEKKNPAMLPLEVLKLFGISNLPMTNYC